MPINYKHQDHYPLHPLNPPMHPNLPTNHQNQVAGFSAGFLAFARVALPVRAAVALAITPPLSKYVIQPLIDRGVLQEREPAEE